MRNAYYGCVVGVALMCLLSLGCSESEPGAAGAGSQAEETIAEVVDPVVHRYPLRGRIVSLIDPLDPVSELRIHHERIEDFKMGDGEPAPMMQMTMSFSPGPDETLEGIAVGDAVSFVFEMHWQPAREMRVVEIKKLPADTVLGFEVDRASGGSDHAGHDGH